MKAQLEYTQKYQTVYTTVTSLWYFSDALESGYGQTTHVRFVKTAGKGHNSLVIAKSRLGPMKYTSITRLELEAAVLSTKMSVLVKKQFGFVSLMEYYWTNSQVVIGYLTNTKNDSRYL